jgi:hypothetical protein
MWILRSFSKDLTYFILPGVLSILLATLYPSLGETSLIYGFIATAFIDSGHVYTTVWRTYFHPEERSSHWVYLVTPVAVLFIFTSWYYLELPGMWSFVVYATLFHHLRQYYGFSKWYQQLNQRTDSTSDNFLYALCVLPFIAYHFRDGVVGGYYSTADLFLFPDQRILGICLGVYFLTLVAWVVREVSLYGKGIREPNRLLSVAFPSGVYAYCFLIGETITQTLFPLLFVHGVSYFAIMGQSLTRTRSKVFRSGSVALAIILLTGLIFGSGESWLEEEMTELLSEQPRGISSLVIGLSLTPLYCHYVFDAFIWKRGHRESALVYQRE